MKFKKGDEVLITSGKNKGSRGKIEKTLPEKASVFIPGLNIYKKNVKKRDEKNPGGIIEFSRPLPVGNIAIICPKCNRPTRIGYNISGKEKLRICRKCQTKI